MILNCCFKNVTGPIGASLATHTNDLFDRVTNSYTDSFSLLQTRDIVQLPTIVVKCKNVKRKQPFYKKIPTHALCLILPVVLLFSGFFSLPAHAVITDPADRKAVPIESNLIVDWPTGPTVGAQSALVMDASNGVLLYEKNVHERLYPASTTKLMTCLLAWEHSSLTETVTVSPRAVALVPIDGSKIGLNPGEQLSMEEMLYGIMVGSGNEAANAVAEHVAGSLEEFVKMMNEKAVALGCKDTHFTNPNGLHDDDHYTSAYDLALIARAFFNSVALSEIGGTAKYHFEATPTQPDDFTLKNKHALITGETACEGVIGGKTGFTDQAGECLVTCAERDGLKLISVVLFEDSPQQFSDSASLLDYGYGFFSKVSMMPYADSILPAMPAFFLPESNLFGRPVSALSFATGSHIDLPKDADVADTLHEVLPPAEHDDEDTPIDNDSPQNTVARIHYSYHDAFVGDVSVVKDVSSVRSLSTRKVIYVNLYSLLVKMVLICICILTPILVVRGIYLYRHSRAYLRKQRMKRSRMSNNIRWRR